MKSNKNSTKYIYADTRKCKACWACIDECQYDVLGKINLWFHKHVVIKHPENCRGCKSCIAVCPNGVFESMMKERASVHH
ncbi:MAG: ferredoxin family protein [Proteobacteria bacterium]|nr:ferredoxin family protein [Pseudomonadota bacterium]